MNSRLFSTGSHLRPHARAVGLFDTSLNHRARCCESLGIGVPVFLPVASPIRRRASASAPVRACGRGAQYPLPARGVLYRTPTNARNYQLLVSATLTPFADSTSRSEPA